MSTHAEQIAALEARDDAAEGAPLGLLIRIKNQLDADQQRTLMRLREP